jgi:hypothetical protein
MICPNCKTEQSGGICKLCSHNLQPEKEVETKERTYTTINKVSPKQAKINAAKAMQLKGFKEERPGFCTGCKTTSSLTNSHLVPVGQNRLLQLNVLNQVWHCKECHHIWEHDKQGRKKLLDYQANMEMIKKLDFTYYNIIINKHGL